MYKSVRDSLKIVSKRRKLKQKRILHSFACVKKNALYYQYLFLFIEVVQLPFTSWIFKFKRILCNLSPVALHKDVPGENWNGIKYYSFQVNVWRAIISETNISILLLVHLSTRMVALSSKQERRNDERNFGEILLQVSRKHSTRNHFVSSANIW